MLSKNHRVMIMAGGTGGHVFPALAVAETLLAAGAQIAWLGTRAGIESDQVPARDIELNYLTVEGIRGRGISAFIKAPWLIAQSVFQASSVLARFKPTVVLGMGGFASGPGVIAARLQGIPLVIHEQNSIAGTTNRISAKLATRVMQGFPDTLVKGEWCGNPVRPEISNIKSPKERFQARNSKDPVRLLVLGGSRGALAINEILPKALALIDCDQRPAVLHQTGKAHAQRTKTIYRQHGHNIDDGHIELLPFLDEIHKAYSWADFVICRAGALTIAELTTVGLGGLLIPFPHATDDHQTANAEWLVKQGAATLIQQSDLSAENLAEQIKLFCASPDQRLKMAMRARALVNHHAADRIAQVCMEVASG